MGIIAENVAGVRARIIAAALRAGRDPASVRLMAASKTVEPARIREAAEAGVALFGENYVQEAEGKIAALSGLAVEWHLIGSLQTNKAKVAARVFSWVQTVDRPRLAEALGKEAKKARRVIPVLLEVHLGGEDTKGGCAPEGLPPLLSACENLPGVDVRGLMAVPPWDEDPEASRPWFRELSGQLSRLRGVAKHPERFTDLSMGMSHDFEVAVEEGATIVRVGTAIFGARPKK